MHIGAYFDCSTSTAYNRHSKYPEKRSPFRIDSFYKSKVRRHKIKQSLVEVVRKLLSFPPKTLRVTINWNETLNTFDLA